MINLTDIRGNIRCIDAGTILEVKSVPDTLLMFLNGNRMLVKESVGEILSLMKLHGRMRKTILNRLENAS